MAQRSAKVTGLSASKLQARLGSKRASTDSAIIDVTYTTDHADANAEKVVSEVVNQAGAFLSKGRAAATEGALAASEQSVDAANRDAKTADAAVTDFLAKHGGVEPAESVTAIQSKIIELDLAEAQANADGNTAAAAAAVRSRDALSNDLGDGARPRHAGRAAHPGRRRGTPARRRRREGPHRRARRVGRRQSGRGVRLLEGEHVGVPDPDLAPPGRRGRCGSRRSWPPW